MENFVNKTIDFIRDYYEDSGFIPLHRPVFNGNELKYTQDTIKSTFVSSVGAYVDKFEYLMKEYTQTQKAVAVVNGTSGLHVALRLVGVESGTEVITQALTFVATANAISYNNAIPAFVDVDIDTMSLSPKALQNFLAENCILKDNKCFNKTTNRRISACLPMHTFGFPGRIGEVVKICQDWKIPVIEDAAESLGSSIDGKHTGGFGKMGVFSFNGNKIITSGGGGAIVTNDNDLGILAKHLTTTAKRPHAYEYIHDELGFNFRMPNLNAALACAQLENLNSFLEEKRALAALYNNFFKNFSCKFYTERQGTKANYWLMCIQLENRKERDDFLFKTNNKNIMTRPIWQLMYRLPMYSSCPRDEQKNAEFLEDRIVNIPSSVRK